MEDLKLMCAYSSPPNSLKYCGPECGKKLFEFATEEFKDESFVKDALSKFEVMFPYLELIAQANGKSPFDEEVVKAYWQGNSLLEKVRVQEWKKTVSRIGKNRNWPKGFAEKYSARISEEFLPHHSFHVLNSFSLTVKEPEIFLDRINNCIISWGKVQGANSQELIVEKRNLELKEGKLEFGKAVLERVKNTAFEGRKQIVDCEIGDWVSMHWGFACKKLEKQEVKSLEKHTMHNLAKFKIIE